MSVPESSDQLTWFDAIAAIAFAVWVAAIVLGLLP